MTTFTTQDRQEAERDDVAKKALENFKPQWQDAQRTPLTDEQIQNIYLEKYDGHMGFLSPDEVKEFARAIERAHGIGE
jgi:C-terminal processing protease CtpA/Prc